MAHPASSTEAEIAAAGAGIANHLRAGAATPTTAGDKMMGDSDRDQTDLDRILAGMPPEKKRRLLPRPVLKSRTATSGETAGVSALATTAFSATAIFSAACSCSGRCC